MKNIQCKRCFFFTPEWCPKKRDSLDPDLIRDCQYYRTKTNADRVRAKSDEELASLFSDFRQEHWCPPNAGDCTEYCVDCWLKWLKQEAGE